MKVIESTPNAIDLIAEEFVERFRKGERPAVSEYEARFPEQAEAIRDLFPTLVVLENLKPATTPVPTADQAECASEVASLGKLGDYRIVREIGRGGMGIVYEAVQESLGRQVALKVLPKQLMGDSLRQARFEREARAAARLHHTNIVPVFGVGAENGLQYYAMQYINGLGLDEVLLELKRLKSPSQDQSTANRDRELPAQEPRRREVSVTITPALLRGQFNGVSPQESDINATEAAPPRTRQTSEGTSTPARRLSEGADTIKSRLSDTTRLSDSFTLTSLQVTESGSSRKTLWQSIARIGTQVGAALHYAHEEAVLHRDIKPSNLLLDTRGTVWVTDFGLAKADDQRDLTNTGDVLGTLRYMAPEMFSGQADRRSDVYSLGLTLYELLALRPAFDESDRGRLIRLVLHESPPRLRTLDPSIPRDLETIIHKAIDRELSHRYQSAQELADDLQRFLIDVPILARRASSVRRFTRWCGKNRVVATLAVLTAASLLLVMAVLTVSQVQIAQERDRFRDALVQSLVAQARFQRSSKEMGQRAESLLKLTEAAALDPGADLRNDVIRCLALHDLERVAKWSASFPNHAPDSVAFDPTLTHYVSYEGDAVEIRRTPTSSQAVGKLVQRLAIPKCSPRVAKFSGDGRLLAVCVDEANHCKLSVWDWQSGRQLLTVSDVSERAFDVDRTGNQLVCCLRDGENWIMKIFDLATGSVLTSWTLLSGPSDAHFEPDGPLVACSFPAANCVQIFDSRNGKVVHDLDFGEDISAIAWHPAGNQLAVGRGFDVSITCLDSPENPAMVLYGHRWMIHALQYHPSGEFLLSHSLREGLTKLWDLRTQRELLSTTGLFVRFDFAGSHVAFVHADSLALVRLLGEQEYQTMASPMAAIHDSWRTVYHPTLPVIVECGRIGVCCWDLHHRRKLASSEPEMVYTVCFDPLTGDLLTAGDSGLQRWKLQIDGDAKHATLSTPQPLAFTDGDVAAPVTGAMSLVCTPDGRQRVAAFRDMPFLYVQDVSSDSIRRVPCDPKTAYIALSPDGRWIAAGTYKNPGFYVWDTHHEGTSHLLAANGRAAQVVFSPDGEHLVACANDRYVLFKVGTWEILSEIQRPTMVEGPAAFSPDSRILALSMTPRAIQLHEVKSTRILATLDSGDPINILNIQFAPQGGDALSLACGSDGLRIWNLASLRQSLRDMHLDW